MSAYKNQFHGLVTADLEKEWHKRHKRSRRTAFYTKVRIAYMVVMGFLIGLLSLWNAIAGMLADIGIAHLPVATQIEDTTKQAIGVTKEQTTALAPSAQLALHLLGAAVAVISLVLTFLVIYHVKKYLRENTNIDADTKLFPPLGEDSTKAVDVLLVPLCKRMNVERTRIRLIRPKKVCAFSPSMIENSKTGMTLLVVPSDFLTVLTEHPQAAEAMLAHELGHVVQKDSRLWLYSTIFADQLMRYFLPWYLFILAFEIVLSIGMIALRWPPNAETLRVGLSLAALGAMPPLFLLGFYSKIRRTRRSSEELADLAAWLYVTPHGVGLQKAFALYEAQVSTVKESSQRNKRPTPEESAASFGFFGDVFSNVRYFAMHPSINYRMQKVRHYESVTTGQTRRLRLTNYGFALENILIGGSFVLALLGLVLFPILAQSRAAARTMYCMSNEKQIGSGLLMYAQDYDETFPASLNDRGENVPNPDGSIRVIAWADALMPYTKNRGMYQCPDVLNSQPVTNLSSGDPTSTSYLYNGIIAMQTQASIENPSNTIMLHEDDHASRIGQQAPSLPFGSVLGGNRVNNIATAATHFNRSNYDKQHREGANLAFADGHVRWVRKDKIRYEWFGALQSQNPGLPETFEMNAEAANADYEKSRKVGSNKPSSPSHTDTSSSPAQEQKSVVDPNDGQSPSLPTQRVSIDLASISLYSALKLLFEHCGISYSMNESLKDIVISVHLKDASFEQALNVMLKASNEPLTYSYENGNISIFLKDAPPAP